MGKQPAMGNKNYAYSDPGKIRKINEDFFITDCKQGFWLLADGVGGRAGGEIASRHACQVIQNEVKGGKNVATAIQFAHRSILTLQQHRPDCAEMATSVIVLKIIKDTCTVHWVGDSRAYLYSQNTLMQLTQDPRCG